MASGFTCLSQPVDFTCDAILYVYSLHCNTLSRAYKPELQSQSPPFIPPSLLSIEINFAMNHMHKVQSSYPVQ